MKTLTSILKSLLIVTMIVACGQQTPDNYQQGRGTPQTPYPPCGQQSNYDQYSQYGIRGRGYSQPSAPQYQQQQCNPQYQQQQNYYPQGY